MSAAQVVEQFCKLPIAEQNEAFAKIREVVHDFDDELTPEQAAALAEPVAGVCAGFPALQLSARGLGFFPGAHRPRVIWVGADDTAGQLNELHRLIDLAVKPFVPSEKSEKFSSHITLGRVKPGFHGSLEPVLKRAAILRDRRFGGWLAEEVIIVRSQLTSEGAVHEPFLVCRLAA